jgi:antitoxin MazE
MKTQVQRWGNSLAVRIPKSFAEEVGLSDGSAVNLRLSEGTLVLEPAVAPAPTLDELLAGVNESNLHSEVATGPARGREAW